MTAFFCVPGESEERSSQLTVIIVSSVVSFVFLVVVTVVIIMLCRGKGHCHGNQEDQLFDKSSRSSMTSSKYGPGTFHPPNIMQPQPKA